MGMRGIQQLFNIRVDAQLLDLLLTKILLSTILKR